MRLQVLSDLHLETESFEPRPAPGAEALILAGDIDTTWRGLDLFRGWPVPVLFVPGNHEFDRRDIDAARIELRAQAEALGMTVLDDASAVLADASGRRTRFVGSTRWSDFDVFGPAGRDRALRAGAYFQKHMQSTRAGAPFDAPAVRELALQSRAWLAAELALTGDWAATVAITHFAPSLKSTDPRYGRQPGTASFCNDDEALMPGVALWVHGHLHCRFDYRVGATRVISQARGHSRKGEANGFEPQRLFNVIGA